MINKILALIDKNLEKIIFIIAIFLSIGSFIYYYNSGLITAYGDASSHLNIARRVFDNVNPGLAQLGGYWLPLLHILMIPFVKIDYLWRTGIAGSIVNIPIYILSVLFMYRMVYEITLNKIQAFISSLIIALNLNFLYLQTTAMTEPLFIGTLIISSYCLVKWIKTNNIINLILAGCLLFLASLNRYESWSSILVSVGIVWLATIIKYGINNKSLKKAEGALFLFGTIALLGIFLWLVWQQVIFGNFLFFINSEFSSNAQTGLGIVKGSNPNYHNLTNSILAYTYGVKHISGVIVFGIFLLSIVKFILFNKKNIFKKENLVLLVLLAPYIFEIYAFYKGHAPFNIPEVPEPVGFDPPFFNVRLAIDVLPAVAVFIGLLTKKRIIQVILILLIIINSAMFLPYAGGKIPVLLDALNSEIPARQPTVKWINNNYQGGNILISSAVTDSIIRESGLNYGNFITEGSGKYWTESLKEPENYVKYIIMTSDPRDSIKNHADLNKINSKYNLVAEYYSVQIFKIR